RAVRPVRPVTGPVEVEVAVLGEVLTAHGYRPGHLRDAAEGHVRADRARPRGMALRVGELAVEARREVLGRAGSAALRRRALAVTGDEVARPFAHGVVGALHASVAGLERLRVERQERNAGVRAEEVRHARA